MLGSDRFAFETPNAIDPGELPPSRPQRPDESNSHTQSTASNSSDEDEDDDYRAQRESRARLVNSVSGLDLTQLEAYDPYDDEEKADHSLPNVEEARQFATKLITPKGTESVPQEQAPLSRSVKLEAPGSRHLVRRKFLCCAGKAAGLVVLVIVAVVLSVQISKGRSSSSSSASSSSTENSERDALVTYLSFHQISSRDDLLRPQSPQALAVDWLLKVDPLRFSDTYRIPTTNEPENRLIQRYVLAVLYFSTNGLEWTRSHNFLTHQDECGWFDQEAISTFKAETTAVGVTCDALLRVTTIFLPRNNLVGSVPEELGQLFHLEMISMPNNELSGSVPLGNNLRLEYMNFNYNELSGPLPDYVGSFISLQVLGLSNNKFSGPIPSSWGSLEHLKTLSLDDNGISGNTMVLNHMDSLEYLYLDGNDLTGRVDDSFLRLPNLLELDASHNQLTSDEVLPLHLLQHPSLRILDLSVNQMTARWPDSILMNWHLEFMSLRENQLEGTLGEVNVPHFPKLTHLDLQNNNFHGELPFQMENLENLSYLALGNNDFDIQQIPNLLTKFTGLRELDMQNLNMTGLIPDYIRSLSNLQLLNLGHNKLQGNIPREVWDLPHLSYLLLDHNEDLYGVIPEDIVNAERLLVVTLDHTDMQTHVDPFCQEAVNIDVFSLDCDSGLDCTLECCKKCCNSADCFETEVQDYLKTFAGMWEFNFQRTSYSFDPDLVESVP